MTAAFPARFGGVSEPPLDSLNLGLSVDDDPEHVLENRRRLCAAIGLPQDRLVVPGQVHGTTLAWVGEAEAGRGAFDSPSVIKEHDGLLTRRRGPRPGHQLRRLRAGRHRGRRGGWAGVRHRPRRLARHDRRHRRAGGRRAGAGAGSWSPRPSGRASARAASRWTTNCGAGSRPGSRAPPAPARSTSGAARGWTSRRRACRPERSPSPASAPPPTRASSPTAGMRGRPDGIWR